MKLRNITILGASLTLLAMGPPSVALAGTITVTSWGGSYSASQRKAYYEALHGRDRSHRARG